MSKWAVLCRKGGKAWLEAQMALQTPPAMPEEAEIERSVYATNCAANTAAMDVLQKELWAAGDVLRAARHAYDIALENYKAMDDYVYGDYDHLFAPDGTMYDYEAEREIAKEGNRDLEWKVTGRFRHECHQMYNWRGYDGAKNPGRVSY